MTSARLRLTNLTDWVTADLRAFVRRGLQEIGARPDKIITIKYGRGYFRTLGRATIGGHGFEAQRITLFLPRPPNEIDPILYAKTLAHECAHNLGLRHDSIAGGCSVVGIADETVEWARAFSFGLKSAPAPVSLDDRREAMIRERREKAERMALKWEKRSKVAARTLAKWRRKVTYYAKRDAAGKGSK